MSDLKGKMHLNRFSWCSAPNPDGELTVIPRPVAGFKGPTSKRRGRERKGRGGKGRGPAFRWYGVSQMVNPALNLSLVFK